ncbi:Armadillo-like helical [Neofusicoccum parvum]|nr:Armadillo-like helical [Neofusicoccum parvum]
MATIDDIITTLKDIQVREAKQDDPEDIDTSELTPQRPWKDLDKKAKSPLISELDSDNEGPDAGTAENEDDAPAAPPDPPPPAPKIYNLLLSISQLTQHYLTASSPLLRTSLLDLLQTTFPALARHENSFLPLVNTLWPVLVPRLHDGEAYVVAGACEAMAVTCRFAGDFMRGRVEGVWPQLVALYRSGGAKQTAAKPGRGKDAKATSLLIQDGGKGSGDGGGAGEVQPYYTAAPTRIVRKALVELFVAVVETVQIGEGAFEEALELLLPVLAERAEMREVFERRNADAVWLALLRWRTQKGGGGTEKGTLKRAGWGRPGDWEGRGFVSVDAVE